MSDGNDTPRARYAQQKASAARRGIEFDLTFEEWWDIWRDRYQMRGRNAGQLQMCRTRDEGPYAVGNVRIDNHKGNRADAAVCRKVARASSAYLGIQQRMGIGAAADWMWRRDVFSSYADEDGLDD